jgi:ABC-2 type transport system permease protein
MHHRLWSLIIKELLSYLRDPRTRFILIGPPLVQLFVFSFAATLDVRNVAVGLLNEDGGELGRELVTRITSAGFVGSARVTHSLAELEHLVERREVLLGVHLAADFSRTVGAGNPASVQLLIDGRRANAGQIAASYVAAITAGFDAEIQVPRRVVPRQADIRHWFNPNLEYQWFIVPNLSGVLAMMMSMVITALSIARERELGTFDQLLVSPMAPLEIIAGKTLPALIIGAVLANVMILAGIFVFRVPFLGSFLLLELSLVLFILSVVGFGLMVSAICRTQQQAILGTFMTAIPLILISGFATPVENMPGWLQLAAEADPLKHYLIIVQGCFLKALPAGQVFRHAAPMVLIAAGTLTVATLFVRARLE